MKKININVQTAALTTTTKDGEVTASTIAMNNGYTAITDMIEAKQRSRANT